MSLHKRFPSLIYRFKTTPVVWSALKKNKTTGKEVNQKRNGVPDFREFCAHMCNTENCRKLYTLFSLVPTLYHLIQGPSVQ